MKYLYGTYKDVFALTKARPNTVLIFAIIQVNQPNNIIIRVIIWFS